MVAGTFPVEMLVPTEVEPREKIYLLDFVDCSKLDLSSEKTTPVPEWSVVALVTMFSRFIH